MWGESRHAVPGEAIATGVTFAQSRTKRRIGAIRVGGRSSSSDAGPLGSIDPALWVGRGAGESPARVGSGSVRRVRASQARSAGEEALAACLVALVAAIAIWIVYLIGRIFGRVALFGLKHGLRMLPFAR